jgi:hypothetical protein
MVILVTGIFWFSPEQPLKRDMLILTAVPSEIDLIHDDLGLDGKYIPKAKIIAIDNDHPEGEALNLTEEFYSARSPEISYDGIEMVFCGQKGKDDLWQIYVMDLQTLQTRQITSSPVNCTDPAWLPDGRIAYSRLIEEEKVGKIHVLYSCNPDGTQKERLTYDPNSTISSTVVGDGRILVLSERLYPTRGKKQIMALRVDGTKAELFYQSGDMSIPGNRVWESVEGKVFFIEKSIQEPETSRLVSVDYGHPLSSWEELSINDQGIFHSLFPGTAGQLFVSCQKHDNSTYGLYEFDLEEKKIVNDVYINEDYHLIEPVLLRERKLPMQLPEIVDKSKEKGTLLCHDSDLSMIELKGDSGDRYSTFKVQVFGMDNMLGEVQVEKDGSFYIEVDADTPVRFQTVNARGELLRGPSAWIWVRPNEKRSCIGCHANRELAPENRVPDALYGGMVSLPDGKKSEPIVLSEK